MNTPKLPPSRPFRLNKEAISAFLVSAVIVFTASFAMGGIAKSMKGQAIQNAGLTPKSPFYFMDEWAERAHLRITRNNEKKLDLVLKYSQERLTELEKMEEEGVLDEETLISQLKTYNELGDTATNIISDLEKADVDIQEHIDSFDSIFSDDEELLEKFLLNLSDTGIERLENAVEQLKRHQDNLEEKVIDVEQKAKETANKRIEEAEKDLDKAEEAFDEVMSKLDDEQEESNKSEIATGREKIQDSQDLIDQAKSFSEDEQYIKAFETAVSGRRLAHEAKQYIRKNIHKRDSSDKDDEKEDEEDGDDEDSDGDDGKEDEEEDKNKDDEKEGEKDDKEEDGDDGKEEEGKEEEKDKQDEDKDSEKDEDKNKDSEKEEEKNEDSDGDDGKEDEEEEKEEDEDKESEEIEGGAYMGYQIGYSQTPVDKVLLQIVSGN